MSKEAKLPDEERKGNPSKVPTYLVDDVDDMLLELREYITNAVLQDPDSPTDRKSAIRGLARKLSQFASTLLRKAGNAGADFSFDEFAEQLLQESDLQIIEESLGRIGQPHGDALLAEHLSQIPFPHYESNPDDASTIVEILEDGTRTIGRFVNRKFVAVSND